MAVLQETLRVRRRRGFLVGLLAGQILVVAMDFGGEILVQLLANQVRFQPPPGMSIRSLVFLGMTAGIVLTGLLIFFVLGLQGAGYVFARKKVGFSTSLGRGVKRVSKAAGALALTLAAIGGTAWLMIPHGQRGPTADYVVNRCKKTYQGLKGRIRNVPRSPSPGSP